MATPKKVTELSESTTPQLTHYVPVHDGTGLKKVLLSYIKTLVASSAATWGSITGTLSNQTDLQNALNAKQSSLGFTPENEANKKTSLSDNSDTYYPSQKAVKTAVDGKQDTLVSGTNIKTINNTSLLGSGDITIGGSSSITIDTTPITGGGSGRILFESATEKVSESADLTYASGLLKIVGSTEQLRIGYDASNYISHTVDASGNITVRSYGSSFSDTEHMIITGKRFVIKDGGTHYTDSSFLQLFKNSYTNVGITMGDLSNASGIRYVTSNNPDNIRIALYNGSNIDQVILYGNNYTGIGTNSLSGTGMTNYGYLTVMSQVDQLSLLYNASNYTKTTVGSTGLVTYDAVGSGAGFVFAKTLKANTINGNTFAFASLPSPVSTGMITTITDSNTVTIGATIAGGGANTVLAWYNGTNWIVISV